MIIAKTSIWNARREKDGCFVMAAVIGCTWKTPTMAAIAVARKRRNKCNQ